MTHVRLFTSDREVSASAVAAVSSSKRFGPGIARTSKSFDELRIPNLEFLNLPESSLVVFVEHEPVQLLFERKAVMFHVHG